MTAGSDLDLLVLYDAKPAALSAGQGWRAETVYGRFAQRLVAALSSPTPEGVLFGVDMRLRPSGADGPLAVSLPTFRAYYGQEAETWELMALTRARVLWADPPRFAETVRTAVAVAVQRPKSLPTLVAEVRAMRELVAAERPPAGGWNLKHAPGGLIDIEFTAQTLHLAGAGSGDPFGPGVAEVLSRAGEERLASAPALAALARAWRLQHGLLQVLRAAMDSDANPAGEPAAFRNKLAQAGGARTFATLERKLARAQASAHRAHIAVLRATERGRRRVQPPKGQLFGVPEC
jgi:glutamate-ammonia-ligase adenylyltransferase